MNKLVKTALIDSVATAIYIVLVGSFMFWGSTIKLGRSNSFLAPIALLLLFVSSAAITSYLIFGKPAQMYIDGKRKEALSLLTYTLGFFVAITMVALLLLVLFTK